MKTSIGLLDDVTVSVLDSIDTPISKMVKGLIARGVDSSETWSEGIAGSHRGIEDHYPTTSHEAWEILVQTWVDPATYADAYSYAMDAQALALFTKCEVTGERRKVTKAKANSDFLDAERRCFQTNLRLEKYLCNGPFEDLADIQIMSHIDSIRLRIKKVLGPLPKHLTMCGFGKGATYDDKGAEASLMHKLTSRPTVTANARLLLKYFYESAWGRSLVAEQPYRSDPLVVRGNRFTTVVKNFKTDRGICVEPSVNIYLQLGAGRVLRRRLQRIHLLLDNSQDFHRQLAMKASLTGENATVDMSQASDLNAYNLVKLLLPSDWFEFLDTLRAEYTHVRGKGWVKLEKFSSMGNGYTFELETLLFWAIVSEACEGEHVNVYGDDIIAPTRKAREILAILSFFGHVPNKKKTFFSGVFRESCGGDFFKGSAVRPYFRKEVASEPQHWIGMANGLARFTADVLGVPVLSGPFRKAWLKCLDHLPSDIQRLRGPAVLGDIVIYDPDESRWRTRPSREGRSEPRSSEDPSQVMVRRDRPWEREIETYQPIPVKVPLARVSPEVQLALALYGVASDGYSPRGSVSGYRRKWTPLIFGGCCVHGG